MRGFFSGIGIRILIIAVIAVGALILRDRLSTSASDLKVGDCFDATTATSVKDVQHHPCTEAHTAEVVLVTSHPSPKGDPYPSDADLDTYAENTCIPAILSYVGSEADLNALNYGIFYPQEKDWTDGERQIICYALRTDLQPMTKSLKSGT